MAPPKFQATMKEGISGKKRVIKASYLQTDRQRMLILEMCYYNVVFQLWN